MTAMHSNADYTGMKIVVMTTLIAVITDQTGQKMGFRQKDQQISASATTADGLLMEKNSR
jgi:hypothetical protein